MARKRARYLRLRDRGRRRPKRPLPTEGWLLPELADLAGIKPRLIHYYLGLDLLPRPRFRGTATRYTRDHLLALLAIRRLRQEEGLGLREIKRRLATISPSALWSFVTAGIGPGPVATALGVTSSPRSAIDASALVHAASASRDASESWERLELLPGLELIVKAEASPLARQFAKRMLEHCRGG